jgi:presqualene diphosphate synthase
MTHSSETCISAAFAECEAITSSRQPNLYLVGRYLPPPKYRLFVAAYAAMRVVDDFVDNDFLGMSHNERETTRRQALESIADWQEQIVAAVERRAPTKLARVNEKVFYAFRDVAAWAPLDTRPWINLARAMCRDVNETPITTWDDFLVYCEGATVAPATVFIEILACRINGPGRAEIHLPNSCDYYARDMAMFCYIVHIVRDLWRDALAAPQLLTIPADMLKAAGLRKQDVSTSVALRDSRALSPLVSALMEHAREHAAVAMYRVAEISALLEEREALILDVLFELYYATYTRLSIDAPRFFDGQAGLSNDEVSELIASRFSGASPAGISNESLGRVVDESASRR